MAAAQDADGSTQYLIDRLHAQLQAVHDGNEVGHRLRNRHCGICLVRAAAQAMACLSNLASCNSLKTALPLATALNLPAVWPGTANTVKLGRTWVCRAQPWPAGQSI